MAYGDFKDLTRRTASDKILHDKGFNIAKNLKYGGCQRGFASMVHRFFDKKKLLVEQLKMGICLIKNLQKNYTNQLFENLIKVHSSFVDNIWGANLANMQLINKFDKGIRFLLCVIDIFSKYTWESFERCKKVLQLPMLFKNVIII